MANFDVELSCHISIESIARVTRQSNPGVSSRMPRAPSFIHRYNNN